MLPSLSGIVMSDSLAPSLYWYLAGHADAVITVRLGNKQRAQESTPGHAGCGRETRGLWGQHGASPGWAAALWVGASGSLSDQGAARV